MTTKTGRVLCASLTAGAALSLLNAEAITVRPSEGRIWQTCLDPSQPIRWPWVEGATSARITFASLCDNKTKVTVVEKTGAELYGTCALPAIVDGVERLYDMTLEQLSENSVVETWSARVAMLPGAFVVRDPYGDKATYDSTQAVGAEFASADGPTSKKVRRLSRASYPAGHAVSYLHHRYMRAFRPGLVARMKKPGLLFRLGQDVSGAWQATELGLLKHRIATADSAQGARLTFFKHYGK